MLKEQRHQDIMNILKKSHNATVKELCAELYCSSATIRRDLEEMERDGLITRSFGGATISEHYTDQIPLALRSTQNIAEKKKICAKAAALIKPGDTLFIDSSSTCYFLAPHLREIPDLVVVSNNPYLCITLAEMKVRVLCTGGSMLMYDKALVGSEAESFLRGIHADSAFFSARSLFENELYDNSQEERNIKRVMIEHSDRHYLLIDSGKTDRAYPYRIAGVDQIDQIITEL